MQDFYNLPIFKLFSVLSLRSIKRKEASIRFSLALCKGALLYLFQRYVRFALQKSTRLRQIAFATAPGLQAIEKKKHKQLLTKLLLKFEEQKQVTQKSPKEREVNYYGRQTKFISTASSQSKA